MSEPKKVDLSSMDIAAQKREELKQALGSSFPEVFSEGYIDFDQLKRVLGHYAEASKERFGLNWAGKAECTKVIQQSSTATLKPDRTASVNYDETENVFIEGDNLEVLKVIQKSYFGKVKMIYIDPPYNTGGEFIYPDKFSESLETYLQYTGQKDSEGRKFSTNADTSGRFHSNWLNMLYPRLYLAKNLLREDGLVFVSIDDNEVHNLRNLMNEIFGDDNFVDTIIWKKRYGGGAKEKYLVSMHEYILVYAKDLNFLPDIFIPLADGQVDRYYKNTDENFAVRGPYRTHPLEAMKSFDTRDNLNFPIPAPDGSDVWPKRQWRWSRERAFQALKDNEIDFQKGKDGNWILSSKQYLKDEKGEIRQTKAFSIIDDVYSQHGTAEIYQIFGDAKVFDFPKPSGLLRQLIRIATSPNDNDIVVDFFAGSCSTAHAILAENAEDGGNRRFLAVQLPEKCQEDTQAYKAGFKNISEIGKERIRRVINSLYVDKADKLDLASTTNNDLGFRSFNLSESNFRVWKEESNTFDTSGQQLDLHVAHVSSESAPEDILFELLLKAGFPLSTKISIVEIAGKSVFSIEGGAMLICLEQEISPELIDGLAAANPLQVICLDEAFKGNDQLKANAVQTFKARAQAEESEIVFRTV